MGGIPVLDDSQMNVLRRVVGTNQKFDLTGPKKSQVRRFPTYEEDNAIVTFGVVVIMPTGGVGEGAVQNATPTTSGGAILASGASIPVVMLYLDGAN